MARQVATALVVDDSRLACAALGKLLEQRGIAVAMALFGSEALEYLRGTRPDIVFLGAMLAEMDGFEVARRVLADPACRQLPVVVYSSEASAENQARVRRLGAVGLLGKPPDPATLDAVLAKVAGRPAAAPALADLERRLRQLAEDGAERIAADTARRVGTAAARALLPELMEEARRVAIDSVDDAELQRRLRGLIEQDAAPLLRRELLTAAQQAAEAVLQAELENRAAALDERLLESARLFAAAEVSAMRGPLLGKAVAAGAAAGLLAGVAAGLLF